MCLLAGVKVAACVLGAIEWFLPLACQLLAAEQHVDVTGSARQCAQHYSILYTIQRSEISEQSARWCDHRVLT